MNRTTSIAVLASLSTLVTLQGDPPPQPWVARWLTTGGGFVGERDDLGRDVAVDVRGNSYVLGMTKEFSTANPPEYEVVLMKYEAYGPGSDGQPAWTRRVFGSGPGDDIPCRVLLDSEGNAYVGASTMEGNRDFFVRKYLPNGAESWTVILDSGGNDMMSDMLVTPTGQVFVTGTTTIGAERKFFTARILSNGTTAFQRVYQYGNAQDCVASAVAVDRLGVVIVAGSVRDNADDDWDWLVVKYDGAGNLQQNSWLPLRYDHLSASGQGGLDNEAYDVAVDASRAIYVVGYGTEQLANGPTSQDTQFMTQRWTYSGVRWGGSQPTDSMWPGQGGLQNTDDRALQVALCDNDLYVAGYSKSGIGAEQDNDFVLLKYGQDTGTPEPGFPDAVVYDSGHDDVFSRMLVRGGSVYLVGSTVIVQGQPEIHHYDYLLVRVNENGGIGNVLTYGHTELRDDLGYGVGLQSAGLPVVAGQSDSGSNDLIDIATVRLVEANTVYFPGSGSTIEWGTPVAGSFADLFSSDDAYLQVQRHQGPVPLGDWPVTIIIEADAVAEGESFSIAQIALEIEAHVNEPQVKQRISFYDWIGNDWVPMDREWEPFDERQSTVTDSVVNVSVPCSTERFVQSNTGVVRARIEFTESGPVGNPLWSAFIDRANFRVVR